MVVGAAGDQPHARLFQGVGQGSGIGDDLVLIGLEFGLQRFAQGYGLGGDDVHQRAALAAGKDGGVDLLGDDGVVGQDHAAAGAAQGLVIGGGHHIGVGHGAGMLACGHHARDVGDVHHQIGARFPGDFTEALEIDDAGVGRRAGDDHAGAMLQGQRAHLIVVDQAGVGVTAVGDGIVDLAGKADLRAVGQMAAAGQVHAQHGVAGLAQREEDRLIRLGAGMGLHVGVVRVEQPLGAIDADVLDHVHVFAAAVIAMSGIALGVLVGEHRAHRSHDRLGHDVFRGDQLQVVALALKLLHHDVADLRVVLTHKIHALLYHSSLLLFSIKNRPALRRPVAKREPAWAQPGTDHTLCPFA